MYKRSVEDPEGFWAERAEDASTGPRSGTRSLEWQLRAHAVRSSGSRAASSTRRYNCVDRWVEAGKGDKPAIIFEGDPGDNKVYTYAQLKDEVSKFANVLKKHGVKKGDRVALYLPMIAELPIVMLACARIGAIHMMVFGGFSRRGPQGPHRQLRRQGPRLRRQGLPRRQDHRQQDQRRRRHRRRDDGREGHRHQARRRRRADDGGPRPLVPRRDGRPRHHRRLPAACRSTPSIRSSSSTPPAPRARPRASCTRTGGYLLYAHDTAKYVFNLHDDDIHFCTADIGWITGHSYIVYGPLGNGATSILFEGLPTYPKPDRYWQVVEKHKATTIYTAPTVIRSLMGQGDEWVDEARHADACASWARSASRSTPTAGSGTTRRSARAASRCATRGGRPRPAAS